MKTINKLIMCVVASSLLLVNVVSADEADLSSKLYACSQINESQARLSCFDSLNHKNPAVIAVVKKPMTSGKSVVTEQEIADFAKDHVQKTEEELANEIKTIELTISKLSKTVRGQWKIIFENGQKWQQKDTTRITLTEGIRVTLTKGAFGSVFMKKEDSNKRIKVKRLK